MACEVVFSPEAQTDLLDVYDYIAPRGGPERALAYVERLQASCMSLGLAPERGTRREDIRPSLRVTGFERRVTVAFHIGENRVVIDRLLYGGRNLEESLDNL